MAKEKIKHKDSRDLCRAVAVRLSPAQYAMITEAADREGVSLSSFCRAAAVNAAIGEG